MIRVSPKLIPLSARMAKMSFALLSAIVLDGLMKGHCFPLVTSIRFPSWRTLGSQKLRCISVLQEVTARADSVGQASLAFHSHLGTAEGGRGLQPSPVEERWINGRRVFFKRDDLLSLKGSKISGNKARKLWAVNQIPASEFPSHVVSFGGPQSNSMLAIAAVVNSKNNELGNCEARVQGKPQPIRFLYYTKPLPETVRQNSVGNLARAKELGMELVELSRTEYEEWFGSDSGGSPLPPSQLDPAVRQDCLWVPQGGAFAMAEKGAKMLADEISAFYLEQGLSTPLTVCLPGGTCSTALLVHRALREMKSSGEEMNLLNVEVVVVPCVGGAAYAQRQMESLNSQVGAPTEDIPAILEAAPRTTKNKRDRKEAKYFSFGRPSKQIIDTYDFFRREHQLVLDLIYGAPAWTILLRHWDVQSSTEVSLSDTDSSVLAGREILYVHTGGLEGIESQLQRYHFKGLVSDTLNL